MTSTKGTIAVQVVIILLVAALTSGIMLLLVHLGVLSSDSGNEVDVLNAQFVPLERSGDVQVRQVDFCKYVDTQFACYQKSDTFAVGEDVYLRFLVESSTFQGQIMLMRNYRIVDPAGDIIMDLEQQNSYIFEQQSGKDSESVAFADYFSLGDSPAVGEYQVEILIENPLLDKRVTLVKRFMVQ